MTAPLYISWSQLRAHEECHQKSYLVRSGRKSTAKDIRNYFHGMVVDSVMRHWLKDPQPGAMTDMVDAALVDVEEEARTSGDGIVRWRNAGDKQDVRQFCHELVLGLEPILRQHVLPYEFHSGLNFKIPVTVPYLDGTHVTCYLRGEMDLLTNTPEGWVVWDLKGTRDGQYWRKVLGQLIFYDLAVIGLHGTTTAKVGLIQPMCEQPILEFTINEDQRRALWSRILRMTEDIWRQNHEPTQNTGGCTRCEVRHACQRFKTTDALLDLAAGLRKAATQ